MDVEGHGHLVPRLLGARAPILSATGGSDVDAVGRCVAGRGRPAIGRHERSRLARRPARERAAVPRHGPARGGRRAAAHATATWSTSSPASPRRGAPEPVRDEADPAARAATRSATPSRPASRSCARRSPGTTAGSTGSTSPPTTSWSPPARSGGFLLAFLAAFEAGDRVAMARPGYPCYRNVLTALGCEVVEIPTGPENRFQPTVEQLEERRGDRRRAWSSPARPTRPARCCCPPSSRRSRAWCEARGVQLVSDEIYHGIEYARSTAGRCRASRLGDLARGGRVLLVLASTSP